MPELKRKKVEELCLHLSDLDRIDPLVRGMLLKDKVDLERGPIRVDPSKVDAAGVGFLCDTLTAAILCDVIRSNDRKLRQPVTRVYLKRADAWAQLSSDLVLTEVENGKVRLNWSVFTSQIERVDTVPLPLQTVEVGDHDLVELVEANNLSGFRSDQIRWEAQRDEETEGISELSDETVRLLKRIANGVDKVKEERRVSIPYLSWKDHKAKWRNCDQCSLCTKRRRNVVLARGSLPCDIVFIGEAPGESEDSTGLPFNGPAGGELDKIVESALELWQVPGTEGAGYNSVRWVFTNLVCCIPRGPDQKKAEQPDHDDILACQERLAEFVRLADGKKGGNIKVIVRVGRVADDYLDPEYKHSCRFHRTIPQVSIVHPSSILRAKDNAKSGLRMRASVVIRDAVEKYVFPQTEE